jgi:uncharacterized DUF497 family protein
MGQFEFVAWLYFWLQQSQDFDFEWDSGNISKSANKHGVATDEVESVFQFGLAVAIGRQTNPPVHEERLCIVGPSSTGRMISVVFTIREGRVRPISSRIASRKERGLYEALRKATQRVR